MSLSPYVFDVTEDDFASLVLANSAKGPVLVHYWSAKAGPCLVLMPRLVKLCAEYRGKFLLAMVSTDKFGRLARAHGVTSVPTVKVFWRQQVVHTIHGPQSDAEFRGVIDHYVARESDRAIALALRRYQAGNADGAFALLADAAGTDPGNARIPLNHAKLLALHGRIAEAEALLAGLPPTIQEQAPLSSLKAHLGFLRTAQEAPAVEELERQIAARPESLEARYQLAAQRLVRDEYEAAMDALLEIARRDRAFRDDGARKGLVAIFTLLESEGELVSRYRSLLSQALRAH